LEFPALGHVHAKSLAMNRRFIWIANTKRRNRPAPFPLFEAFGYNLFGANKEMKMILIADDDSDFAENCSMMLESYGYDVSVVLSAADALAKISDRQPDLLISDCCMPEMGGLQLSEQLKARPADMQFPILLMSGSLQCRVARGASYDAFLRKPFLAEELLLEVRKLLQNCATTEPAHESHQ
jgi:two-component system chemotaxis response regulator CheY